MTEDRVRAVANFACQHPGEDPVEVARNKLSEIDNELCECNERIVRLRAEKAICSDVLSRFGESIKKPIRSPAPAIDLDDDSEANVETRLKIKSLLDEAERVTKQEIVQSAGGYGHDARINRMLKWMGDRGLIANDDEGWIRGPNWSKANEVISGKAEDGKANSE